MVIGFMVRINDLSDSTCRVSEEGMDCVKWGALTASEKG